MGNVDQTRTGEGSFRQQANRFIGLVSYAMGFIVLGIIAFCIYDDPQSLTKSYGNAAILGAGALVCFGIGYTTERKKK